MSHRRLAIAITSVYLVLACMVTVQGAPLDPNAFASIGTLDLSSGSVTFNTSTLSVSGAFSGTGVLQPQGAGLPDIAVFTFDGLAIEGGVTLNLIGSRPIALLSKENAMIDQFIDISGGPPTFVSIGGTARLGGGAGGNGEEATTDPQNGSGPGGGGFSDIFEGEVGGGGGAGFGGNGGDGGARQLVHVAPGGMAYGDLSTALQGGSGGGGGTRTNQFSPQAGGGGGSGGAVEIGALGAVYVAQIFTQGAPGASVSGSSGGGGGGSGGAVLLHGQTVAVAGGIYADGGDGGASTGAPDSGGGAGGRVLVETEMLSLASVPFASVNGGQRGAGTAFVNPGIGGQSGIAVLKPLTTIIPTGSLVEVRADGTLPTDTAGAPWSLKTDRLRFDAGSIGAALAPVASAHDIDLNGGIVAAGQGWNMTGASAISGFGHLSAPFVGGATNHVAASGGTLTLGDANSTRGFNFAGVAAIGAGAMLNLLDADKAGLGAVTTLAAGGRLNSLNGVALDGGEIMTASGAAEIAGKFTNQGTVNGPTAAGQFLTFADDVDGIGSYTGNVLFSDGFSAGASPTQVSLENVAFDATAELSIELGGATPGSQFDQLTVAGDAMLSGKLKMSLINDFTPSIGQTFTILSANAVDGTFTTEILPSVPGLVFDVIYNTQSVVLIVSPAFTADFDNDGDVDGGDLNQWHGDFGVNALSDADNDGDSDGADFLTWQRQLGSVPAVAATAVVPEPETFLLFFLASAGFRRTAGQKRQELINE
ncbi:MAG: hypothetical protein H0T51_24550 [Pirellulales bacterium]|nr:hypothetical protein [Pirellulales bacterium]